MGNSCMSFDEKVIYVVDLRDKANTGDAKSQYEMAEIYYDNNNDSDYYKIMSGTDKVIAKSYYLAAAKRGHKRAIAKLKERYTA